MLRIIKNAKLALALVALFLCLDKPSFAQNSTFQENGVFDQREGHYAFTNATIYISADKKIDKGVLIIKKGKVVAAGANISIPKDAAVIDLQGKYIYPSFIDLYATYGMSEVKAAQRSRKPQLDTKTQGAYASNEAIKSENAAYEVFKVDEKKSEEMRKNGFGAVLTHIEDGLVRGSGAMVLLGTEREHNMIVKPLASKHLSFSKGTSTQDYPSSLTGFIALLRQNYYDAIHYKNNPQDREYNISLEKWLGIESLPTIFDAAQSKYHVLRADKIGDEFKEQYIIRGAGDEYQRIDAIKATNAPIIASINFPLAYDVKNPYDAFQLQLSQLMHWDLAYTNLAKLAQAKIPFTITQSGTAADMFWKNLRLAVKGGLSEKDLLNALTLTPAQLLKVDKELGTLENGKIANFFIASTNILSEKATIIHNWVNGKPYAIKDLYFPDFRGRYELSIANGDKFGLMIHGDYYAPEGGVRIGENRPEKAVLELSNKNINIAFQNQDASISYRLIGAFKDANTIEGKGQNAKGEWITFTARKVEGPRTKDEEFIVKVDTANLAPMLYPFMAFGNKELPKQETVHFKNATVWTGEKDGILENTDVIVEAGKIKKIGKNLATPSNAKVVDATGKHLTAGIIDEHSHICLQGGVNEGTQVSSAEVRMGDVINADDANMYRQLAGGVTAAQLLHGSANPIGGQAAMVKFRWGVLPEAMKIKDAPGFIKFALGENVKQANWGDETVIRFPQTRMGVEQVYEDYFTRAQEYAKAIKANPNKTRRDLDLETLVEILESKRFITCHSYVKSEIIMLMRIAEKFGFKLNTFTHILEGYKVADQMKEHGVGASTFSDWWAYKPEVLDAIPYNASILTEMGIITAINSDDAEMGRRLNQEAAKSVKYGGMSEEQAWNMVTINPAKLLRIDKQTGSIKEGKDADLVLWTNNPLSIYAIPAYTFVDGICYFDLEKDKAARVEAQELKNKLIQKSMKAKDAGQKTQPVLHIHEPTYNCGHNHDIH